VNGKCILSNSITEQHSPYHLMIRITQLLEDDNIHSKFKSYVEQLTLQDSTIKFWYQFIFIDCFSYLSLYLAIRSSNWNLWMGLICSLDFDFLEDLG